MSGSDAGDAGDAGDALPDGGDVVPPRQTDAVTLKVLTLNVWTGGPAEIAASIVESGADLAALQEISAREVAETCKALGEGWYCTQPDGATEYAIASRAPVLQRIGVTQDLRGGLGASIEVRRNLRVHIFATHLMYTPYGPYQLGRDGMDADDVVHSEEQVRLPGITQLLALAAPYVGSAEPAFLAGDFNAPSHLDYQPAMPWPTSRAVEQSGLVDSYAELHPDRPKKSACEFAKDDPGITWARLAEAEPNGCYDRIDFVHYSAADAVALTSETLELSVSDHRAVLTKFELVEPERAERPRSPLPAQGQQRVHRHALLSWVAADKAVTQHVYLGTTSEDMQPIATTTETRLGTPRLAGNTRYVWRVDTDTPDGTLVGETWSFTTDSSAGFEPDKAQYAPGEVMRLSFDGANRARDWIGVYARGAAYGADSAALSWKYVNDSTTAGELVQSGTMTLSAPAEAGDYVVRLFDDDGYTVEDVVSVTVVQ
jgi:endonuclease/exonuclease/phosphatase (EEP) superfamily protein YafD